MRKKGGFNKLTGAIITLIIVIVLAIVFWVVISGRLKLLEAAL